MAKIPPHANYAIWCQYFDVQLTYCNQSNHGNLLLAEIGRYYFLSVIMAVQKLKLHQSKIKCHPKFYPEIVKNRILA